MVSIGCGAVAFSILNYDISLFGVAALWGFGVVLGIVVSSPFSNSHLNPAISLGFLVNGKIKLLDFGIYVFGQFIGALLAAGIVYLIFIQDIQAYDNGIFSEKTAMIFGEYYPNPQNSRLSELSTSTAILMESVCTFLLMLSIFFISNMKKLPKIFRAFLIGLVVCNLILAIAPFTQAGLNPARDLSPRIFSYFVGYDNIAFNSPNYGYLLVYVVAPFLGAFAASLIFKLSLEVSKSDKITNRKKFA